MRPRKLASDEVQKMWNAVQQNIGRFQRMFGANMIVYDNSSDDDDPFQIDDVIKQVRAFMDAPPKKKQATDWLANADKTNANFAQKDKAGKATAIAATKKEPEPKKEPTQEAITEPTKLSIERFPSSDKANDWMSKKVAYWAKNKPNELHNLFDPSSGDYMPLDVHVGSSWKKEHLDHYRNIKKQYPDAVKKAKDSTQKYSSYGYSSVGDRADFSESPTQEAITESQFDEAAGEKDACYHKVKSRYKVWPSAYASGALAKCRKVGAKNWGNKS
jgi:hypothetical protein